MARPASCSPPPVSASARPVVRCWAVALPCEPRWRAVACYGVVGDDARTRELLARWTTAAHASVSAPVARDLVSFRDTAGETHHVWVGYWLDPARALAFRVAAARAGAVDTGAPEDWDGALRRALDASPLARPLEIPDDGYCCP